MIQSFNVRAGAKVCGLAVRSEFRAALTPAAPVASNAPSPGLPDSNGSSQTTASPAAGGGAAQPSAGSLAPGSPNHPASPAAPVASNSRAGGPVTQPASPTTPVQSSIPVGGADAKSAPAASPNRADISTAEVGGVVESITSEYGPGLLGHKLINGRAETVWKASAPVVFPTEIVFSFIHRQPALVSALTIKPAADGGVPKEIEVWTSSEAPQAGYVRRAAQTLPNGSDEQTVTFPPVMARFVKLRILSGYQPGSLELNEVTIEEGRKQGYVPLAERDPEMAVWGHGPRRAAQAGIEWLQVACTSWQKEHQCFGCHVQAQVLIGTLGRPREPVCRERCVHEGRCQVHSGETEPRRHVPQRPIRNGDPVRRDVPVFLGRVAACAHGVAGPVRRLAGRAPEPFREIPSDNNEPPIDQGSDMTTANAVFAFEQAFRETGKPGYRAAAEKGLAWIAAAPANTTQDRVFTILALARYGTQEQRKQVASMAATLKSEQMRDGGWKETKELRGANAFATGQVLYAFKQAGVPIDSAEFVRGVRYLLVTQKETGAWSSFNSQTDRPSDFAHHVGGHRAGRVVRASQADGSHSGRKWHPCFAGQLHSLRFRQVDAQTGGRGGACSGQELDNRQTSWRKAHRRRSHGRRGLTGV